MIKKFSYTRFFAALTIFNLIVMGNFSFSSKVMAEDSVSSAVISEASVASPTLGDAQSIATTAQLQNVVQNVKDEARTRGESATHEQITSAVNDFLAIEAVEATSPVIGDTTIPLSIPANQDTGREETTVPLFTSYPVVDDNLNDSCAPYELTLTSDQKDYIVEKDEQDHFAVFAWVHSAWTSIAGADWIWATLHVDEPSVNQTYSFKKAFDIVGTPSIAELSIAVDDNLKAKINNSMVYEASSGDNFSSATSIDIVQNVREGMNNLSFVVQNAGAVGSTPESNPAGLIYKIVIHSTLCEDTNSGDRDNDGVRNTIDNCPLIANTDQADLDGDGKGDVCDDINTDGPTGDHDGDTVPNAVDNCPAISNTNQIDTDADGIGDECDNNGNGNPSGDFDGDGVVNSSDNCPAVSNPGQLDTDQDGKGDACDADANGDGIPDNRQNGDIDSDGIANGIDNCRAVSNADQADEDQDGKGNACDSDYISTNNDGDSDGVIDTLDNCPSVSNPDQANFDQDLMGDACDSDDDNDGILDVDEGEVLGDMCVANVSAIVTIDEALSMGTGTLTDENGPVYIGSDSSVITTGGSFDINDGTTLFIDPSMQGTYEDANGLVIERQSGAMVVHLKRADTLLGDGRNHINGKIVLSGTVATAIVNDETIELGNDGIMVQNPKNDEVSITNNGTEVNFWLTTGIDEDTFTINLEDYEICTDTIEDTSCRVGVERIVNGGFETPVVTDPGMWQVFTSGFNWMAQRISDSVSELEVQAGYGAGETGIAWTAKEGTQYVELDSNEATRIYQDVATIPGAIYELDYSFSPRPNVSANNLSVSIDGSVVGTEQADGIGLTGTLWIDRSLTFTATGNTTRVQFENTDVSDGLGTFLDAVSMKCTENVPLDDSADDEGSDGGGSSSSSSGSRGGSSGTSSSNNDSTGEVLGASTGLNDSGIVLGATLAQTGNDMSTSMYLGLILLGALMIIRKGFKKVVA